MSWLTANWYSVIALFGVPAMFGIASWFVIHRITGQRERDDRARDARKLDTFRLSRHAAPIDTATGARRRSPW